MITYIPWYQYIYKKMNMYTILFIHIYTVINT